MKGTALRNLILTCAAVGLFVLSVIVTPIYLSQAATGGIPNRPTFRNVKVENAAGDITIELRGDSGLLVATSVYAPNLLQTSGFYFDAADMSATFSATVKMDDVPLDFLTAGATKTLAIDSEYEGGGSILGYDMASSTNRLFSVNVGDSSDPMQFSYLCLGETCDDDGTGVYLNGTWGINAVVGSLDNVVAVMSAEDNPSAGLSAGFTMMTPSDEDVVFFVDADNGNVWASGTASASSFIANGAAGVSGCFDAGDSGERIAVTGGIVTEIAAGNCP